MLVSRLCSPTRYAFRAAGCVALTGATIWAGSCGRETPSPAPPAGAKATPASNSATGSGVDPQAGPPGWMLAAAAANAGPTEQFKQHSASASFALAEGESIDPLVAPGAFQVGYSGVVNIGAPGRYRFGAEALGGIATLTVMSGGTTLGMATGTGADVWTPWIDLPAKPVTVSVQFQRAASGPATLRTLWARQGLGNQGFVAEAIPTSSVSVPGFATGVVRSADSEVRGRVLLGELNCLSCHDAGKGAAVVLKRQAPLLGEVGRRASAAWIRSWVADPQAVKPGCGMPDVLGESPQDLADAEAITHFLVSLGGPSPRESGAGDAEFGRKLFHTVGCVACHGALDTPRKVFGAAAALPDELAPSTPAQPYGMLAGKWSAAELAAFLQDPRKSRPAGRMPSLVLTSEEAGAIAAYLVGVWGAGEGSADFKPETAKVAAGKAAFTARGCASCHELGAGQPSLASMLEAPALVDLKPGAGCLAPGASVAPRYTLNDRDREDLVAGIAQVKRVISSGSAASAPLDKAHRTIAAMGCRNCHSFNEEGGPAEAVKLFFRTSDEAELGDEGRFPPRLSGVGYKLRADWLTKVLTEAGRARPYMATRMPQFGAAHVGELAAGLGAMDGVSAEPATELPKPPDDLVLAGRRLVGESGMNCISCHTYAGKIAGTAGPEMTEFARRIRPEWWRAYILAPARFKPGTRMTAFYETGRGKITDVFGGDAVRQTEALWAYFTAGKAAPPPEGLPSGSGLPVKIGSRPAVFRTFLRDGGSRGIAVGYPIGIHFGFDATDVRLVDAWEGEFIDASAAWKGRGGQVAGGQGKQIWRAPAGPPLIAGEKPAAWPKAAGAEAGYRFKGYRIEKDGTPTFMYTIGEGGQMLTVGERFRPNPIEGAPVVREFEVAGLGSGRVLWVNGGKGTVKLRPLPGAEITVETVAGSERATWFGVGASGTAGFALEIKP